MRMSNQLSLICCTVGRERSVVEKMVRSVVIPEGWTGDLIIVDQNTDGRLVGIESLAREGLGVRRVSSERGLSRARNVGIKIAQGTLVGFPDDDCWYFPGTLAELLRLAKDNSAYSFFSGRIEDPEGRNCLLSDWPVSRLEISMAVTRRTICSSSLFCRAEVLRDLGGFDEDLGVGAKFGAMEEVDIARRWLEGGRRGLYCPEIRVGHPSIEQLPEDKRRLREYSYARGYGYYRWKHGDHVRAWLRSIPVPFAHGIFAMLRGKPSARMYFAVARGRLEGYLRR